MRIALSVLFALLACAPSVRAGEPFKPNAVLLNGDFSAPLDSGWRKESRDFAGPHQFRKTEGGVQVRKAMCGYARLVQDVRLEGPKYRFSAQTRLRSTVNTPGYHATSSLTLSYLDVAGKSLGETRFYTISGKKGPVGSDRVHHVLVPAGAWKDLELDVTEELRTHLPGVVPSQVKALRIALEAFGSGTQGC